MKINGFTTETRNPNTMNLDEMNAYEIVRIMNEEDSKVPVEIKKNLEEIAKLAEWAAEAFRNQGRLIYIGAGTSGRLGVLDASECVPTFGVSPKQVVGIIAGGDKALRTAVEGAEDSLTLAEEDLEKLALNNRDVVVGLAASGRTPYVIGGLKYANLVGCRTAAISCNKNSSIGEIADLSIEAEVGPEVLTGSTRLKSGTAQKLILNMVSTTAMILTGKVYQNLMVNVQMSNEKLQVRAQNIVIESTGVTRKIAVDTIKIANNDVKLAIIMILTNSDVNKAKELLDLNGGHVKDTIKKMEE